jgi:deoxyribodipyrimidine photolyase-related protein
MNTIWIFGDQLSLTHAALARADKARDVVLMIESRARGGLIRYHQQKLVLVYAGMRHFAAELRAAGWQVDYHELRATPKFEDALAGHCARFSPEKICVAAPNDFLFTDLLPKVAKKLGVPVETVPTAQFILSREDFAGWAGKKPRLLMEQHYRRMRERTGYLMDAPGRPHGGAWNFDAENRRTVRDWRKAGAPRATSARVEPDAITRGAITDVAEFFPDHPGRAADFWLPADRTTALAWLRRFVAERLAYFGPYEDMMLEQDGTLFHSVLSPALNLGLLTPAECCAAAIDAYENGHVPLASVEGFVRQIIGWREFINGVYWHRGPAYREVNALSAARPLPAWFYTGETEMRCLRIVIRQAIATGFNHHIQRLMVLGNFLLIAGVNPQAAYRWFLEMYVDAYDWVMAANVLGMVLHADGGYMATKPYAAGAGYLSKMSDYCVGCRYKPGVKSGPDACPFNLLYWDFIARHADRWRKNPRLAVMVQSWEKRSTGERAQVRREAERFLDANVG